MGDARQNGFLFPGIVLYWHQMKKGRECHGPQDLYGGGPGPGAAGSLDTGLNMAVSKGLKGLHLAELAAAVGISKPYFYTFFDSLEDFSLQMMEEQRCRLLRLLEQELARPEGTWEEHVESFFRTILRHRENGILVMTQGEEADLHSRLTPERFQDFRPGQRDFFLRLMALLDIRAGGLRP